MEPVNRAFASGARNRGCGSEPSNVAVVLRLLCGREFGLMKVSSGPQETFGAGLKMTKQKATFRDSRAAKGEFQRRTEAKYVYSPV